jgi:23S rRNA pseudouridine1911/1915/1917 synthase
MTPPRQVRASSDAVGQGWEIKARAVTQPLSILFEDNHLLAIDKPAGLPTMGAPRGQRSAVEEARRYLKRKYHKPGNVYIGVVSRLDAAVSGVLLLARTSKAAARLNEQFKCGTVEKIYWALVDGDPKPPTGELSDYLLKDELAERMRVVAAGRGGAKHAVLHYRRVCVAASGAALLEIQLLTGRKHQIRVQLASRGWPILGDKKYGSSVAFPKGIALHSRRLALEHPVQRFRLQLTSPPPDYWRPWLNEEPN